MLAPFCFNVILQSEVTYYVRENPQEYAKLLQEDEELHIYRCCPFSYYSRFVLSQCILVKYFGHNGQRCYTLVLHARYSSMGLVKLLFEHINPGTTNLHTGSRINVELVFKHFSS